VSSEVIGRYYENQRTGLEGPGKGTSYVPVNAKEAVCISTLYRFYKKYDNMQRKHIFSHEARPAVILNPRLPAHYPLLFGPSSRKYLPAFRGLGLRNETARRAEITFAKRSCNKCNGEV